MGLTQQVVQAEAAIGPPEREGVEPRRDRNDTAAIPDAGTSNHEPRAMNASAKNVAGRASPRPMASPRARSSALRNRSEMAGRGRVAIRH